MKIKRFELALILAMFITLTYSSFQTKAFDSISNKVIRFHVLAHSDESYDQELKLLVRDEVFSLITKITENATTQDECKQIIDENLELINKTAQDSVYKNGYIYQTTTQIMFEYYPQKDYETFSLPAGYYTGVKILIGDGLGQNWWCVLFPPLCTEKATSNNVLMASDKDFITTSNKTYEFRFKFVDTFMKVKNQLNK